ncbi:hypothetical protein ABK040_015469 [Willaertia magna]
MNFFNFEKGVKINYNINNVNFYNNDHINKEITKAITSLTSLKNSDNYNNYNSSEEEVKVSIKKRKSKEKQKNFMPEKKKKLPPQSLKKADEDCIKIKKEESDNVSICSDMNEDDSIDLKSAEALEIMTKDLTSGYNEEDWNQLFKDYTCKITEKEETETENKKNIITRQVKEIKKEKQEKETTITTDSQQSQDIIIKKEEQNYKEIIKNAALNNVKSNNNEIRTKQQFFPTSQSLPKTQSQSTVTYKNDPRPVVKERKLFRCNGNCAHLGAISNKVPKFRGPFPSNTISNNNNNDLDNIYARIVMASDEKKDCWIVNPEGCEKYEVFINGGTPVVYLSNKGSGKGKVKITNAARMTLLYMYGGDNVRDRKAVNTCGNKMCVSPLHHQWIKGGQLEQSKK